MSMSRRSTLAATAAAALLLAATFATATETPSAAPPAGEPASPAMPESPKSLPSGGGSLLPKPSAPDPKPFTLADRYFDAARRGDLEMLKVCIDKGIDPRIKDEVGRSGLMLAIRDGRSLETAQFLRERGASADEVDAVGRSALHEAAGNGDTASVRWLLKEGAKTDRKDLQGRTPLHNAVMGGSKEITLALLEAGSDANVRDNFQDTPLMLACNKGVDEIARALVDKGADPLLKDQEGRTAAQRAVAEENAPYCKALPGAGPLPAPLPPVAGEDLPFALPGEDKGT
jgi:ankyrin repeat protein